MPKLSARSRKAHKLKQNRMGGKQRFNFKKDKESQPCLKCLIFVQNNGDGFLQEKNSRIPQLFHTSLWIRRKIVS
jgi:hypothetical protein